MKRFISLLIIVLSVTALKAQTGNILPVITARFNKYQENHLVEKLFVHTDKNFYLAGELLWFKVYAVDETYHKPLDISRVAYLELLDTKNNAVIRAKISLNAGSGHGSVLLPSSVMSGTYLLRAYTSWMKNYSPELYFKKTLTIINTLALADTKPIAKKSAAGMVDFFPEGGNLVNGVRSKVAFRVTDNNGKGMDCAGAVLYNKDTIALFKTLKFGIGSFQFTPDQNKTYNATIRLPDGSLLSKELPPVYENGYVMELNNNSASTLSVQLRYAGPAAPLAYLLVHSGQNIAFAQAQQLQNYSAKFDIDKSKLVPGVSVITVFNSAAQAVCERLYFNRSGAVPASATLTPKNSYPVRSNSAIDITLSGLSKTETADLSMSVYRLDSLEDAAPENLSDFLELSSFLRGKVENPAYYLNSTGNEVNQALDNLLLTHGWRRFDWAKIFQDSTAGSFKFLPEYTGHIVTGKITHNVTGAPAANKLAYLSVPGKRVQLYTAKSDDEGIVKFFTKDLYGLNELVLQTNRLADSMYHTELISPFSSESATGDLADYSARFKYGGSLYQRNINVQAQNIYNGLKTRQFYAPKVDSNNIYIKPEKRYLLDKYTRFATMEEVLREYVLEIGVNLQRKNYILKITDESAKGFFEGMPLLLFDGVPVSDPNKIVQFDPLKVKSIETVSRKVFLGPAYFEGIASFTTYNGSLAGFELDKNATVVDYEGLQLQREFYSPTYETEKAKESPLPDFRDLLFWKPDITTAGQEKARVEFYTSDQTGNYLVVLQGISSNGKLISKTATFHVGN